MHRNIKHGLHLVFKLPTPSYKTKRNRRSGFEETLQEKSMVLWEALAPNVFLCNC